MEVILEIQAIFKFSKSGAFSLYNSWNAAWSVIYKNIHLQNVFASTKADFL